MGAHPDSLRKKFGPLRQKTLKNALAHRIAKEFPRIGGPRIRDLCAEMILEVVYRHIRSRDGLGHGQVLWLAVSINDPPRRRQRIADTDLVPVVLDLSTPEDIERRLRRESPQERLLQRALRLCRQAHQQGGLLSNCDLAELLSSNDPTIAHLLVAHEKATQQIVPRRATLHDVGTGVTHKRLICRKRFVDGKDPAEVARETYHTLEAVDRYLGQFARVRACRLQGLTPEQTAHALGCTVRLVQEYLAIDRELEPRHA
jgi:hypothetical protein